MKAFSARGHHVTILVIRPERKKPSISFFHEQSLNVYEIHPPSFSPFKGKRGIGKYVNYLLCLSRIEKTISKIMNENKIDYVYSYMPGIGSSLPAMRIKSKFKIKHALDFADFHIFVRPKNLANKSFKNADKIVAITSYLKDYLVTRNIEGNKIHIIPNGVDLELFNSEKFDNDNILKLRDSFKAKKIVLFAGALQDLDIVIRSAKNVIDTIPDVKYVIIGDHRDPNRTKEIWEHKVEKIGLGKYFIFLGRKPRSEIPQYLLCADVCIDSFPNEPYYAAAHPIKLLEYGACAKPVVATKVTETEKIIKHEIFGYLANPNNSEEYGKYLIKLLNDPHLGKKMGEEFQKYVKENFDWNKLALQLENTLKN